jgi:hypothetical protein
MSKANQAHEDGDIEKLKALLISWESRPDAVQENRLRK